MGRSNVLNSYKMLDGADMSADITSDPTSVKFLDRGQIVLEWSGTAVDGEIIVESRQGGDRDKVSSPWTAINFGASILLDTDTGTHSLIFNELPFTELRVRYVRTAGTGDITAYITAKDIGG